MRTILEILEAMSEAQTRKMAMSKFKLHIRGPHVPPGGDLRTGCALWLCYDPDQPNLSCAGISPIIAYRTWYSLYGIKPL